MRAEKNLLLDEIKEKIDSSTALIISSYNRMPPNLSWAFRDKLAKSGGSLEIVRKRVFLKAAEKAGLKLDESLLKGHIGVVFIHQPDAMPAAKVVYKFSGDNQNLLDVVCGKIDGIMYGGADVEMLSKLPGMDEMRSQLIALFVSPMTQTLAVFEAVMAESLSVIEQKSEEKES
jgi:large subunit ribosomal protein L10